MTQPYNPLEKMNLGRSVAIALLRGEVRPLSQTLQLSGAGVYAIYYTGDFEPYAPIAEANAEGRFQRPIYVGKAIPEGGRKGGLTTDAAAGRSLSNRLREHAGSIGQASNLRLEDFSYRCLVVDDIWIPLGENMLIERFKPVWNTLIDGFGNKTPGAGRKAQARSSWDVLHPGRSFVDRLQLAPGRRTVEEIVEALRLVYRGAEPQPLDGGPVET